MKAKNNTTTTEPTLNTKQMNSVIRHRLRNLCAGMKMAISSIQEQTAETHPQLEESCTLMNAELEDLLTFSKRMDLLFADLPPKQTIPSNSLITTVTEQFQQKFPFITLELEGTKQEKNLTNGNYHQLIITELLNNAGEAAGVNGEVKLIWKTEPDFQYAIINSSPNPWPKNIPTPYPTPFTTTRNKHDGIGLVIVQHICEQSNLNLEISTEIENIIIAKISKQK